MDDMELELESSSAYAIVVFFSPVGIGIVFFARGVVFYMWWWEYASLWFDLRSDLRIFLQ